MRVIKLSSFFSPLGKHFRLHRRRAKLKAYGHKLPKAFDKFHSNSKVPQRGTHVFLTVRQTIPLATA